MSLLDDFTGDMIPKKRKTKRTASQVGKLSSEKGKRGELNCVHTLKDITGLSWIRSPQSGAFIGKTNRRRAMEMSRGQIHAMLGDVIPPDEIEYRIIIESKFYKSFAFKMLSEGKCPKQLDNWINELLYDYVTSLLMKDKRFTIPFLYFHINNKGEYVAYNPVHLKHLPIISKPIYKTTISTMPPQLDWDKNWIIEDFKTFFTDNNLIIFKQWD